MTLKVYSNRSPLFSKRLKLKRKRKVTVRVLNIIHNRKGNANFQLLTYNAHIGTMFTLYEFIFFNIQICVSYETPDLSNLQYSN